MLNYALLSTQTSRKELLALDFEGILKYFRVSLPKKYRVEDVSHDLINTAIALKVNCVGSLMVLMIWCQTNFK